MNLVKTSFYTSISTAITFISGFVVTKVVAVAIGPKGMAYVGQFQNTTAIFAMLGIAAISAGVIKYLAEYKDQPEKQQRVITTAVTVILTSSGLVSLAVLLFSGRLSMMSFHSTDYTIIFVIYGIFLTIISLNSLFIAVFNGLKEIRKYTIINISSSLIGLLCTVGFAKAWGLKGVLVAASFSALAMFLVNLFFLSKLKGFSFIPNFRNWDKQILKMLFAFSLMNVVSGFLGPFVQLSIRDYMIQHASVQEAGYWQAVTKISDYYLSFITTVLSVYYLPRLSELQMKHELKKEIWKGYKMILPVAGILALGIWIMKGLIVKILFTADFIPMLPLFKFQLIGDFLKIGSWLLAFLMLSKAMTRMFIITEIVFSFSYLGLSYWMMPRYGVIGATYAFAINYGIYWIAMWLLMRNKINN
ncbi:MAG: hypothetical protein JWQ27_2520 [Ferruginibacter sp.]|nr:hypothetical protein [Ferruginibacter sp.]